jgi:membrane associated rhomboid family serine protease
MLLADAAHAWRCIGISAILANGTPRYAHNGRKGYKGPAFDATLAATPALATPALIRFLNIRQPQPEETLSPEAQALARRHLHFSAFVPGILVVVLWLIHALAWALGSDWSHLGVFPRSWSMLWHVFSAPLIHGDWAHLAANSLPLFVLGFLLLYSYRKVAFPTLLMVWILSGLGVWMIGRPAWHIGASGLVFGINFFLFFSGIFRMDLRSLALSLLVAFAYGGMVWGVFPTDPQISFEAHASGALVGMLAAYLFRNVDRPPIREWEEEDEHGLVAQKGHTIYSVSDAPHQAGADAAVQPGSVRPAQPSPSAYRRRPRVIRLRYQMPESGPRPSGGTNPRKPGSDAPDQGSKDRK